MKKLAIQLGIWGAALGMLAGLVELSIGSQIRPWIGDKENPVILGIITVILSSVAFTAMLLTSKRNALTQNDKLALFLGVLFPAAICFTTVGRLWYLPGALLLAAAAVPDRSQLWIAPQASHTGAFAVYPDEYEQRVIAFFDAALLGKIAPCRLKQPTTQSIICSAAPLMR